MPIRNLFRRIKNARRQSTNHANWGALHAEVDAQFQFMGAAVIGSWEILLTDVARSYRIHQNIDVPLEFSQRLSDAIVPMQQCLQGRSRQIQHAITQHAQQETPSFFNMGPLMSDFTSQFAESWKNSCAYIQPLLAEHKLDAVHAQWLAAADQIHAQLQNLNQVFLQPFHDLDTAKSTIADWREALVRLIEIELYARRTELIAGLSE
jgi:hypothetical protein